MVLEFVGWCGKVRIGRFFDRFGFVLPTLFVICMDVGCVASRAEAMKMNLSQVNNKKSMNQSINHTKKQEIHDMETNQSILVPKTHLGNKPRPVPLEQKRRHEQSYISLKPRLQWSQFSVVVKSRGFESIHPFPDARGRGRDRFQGALAPRGRRGFRFFVGWEFGMMNFGDGNNGGGRGWGTIDVCAENGG